MPRIRTIPLDNLSFSIAPMTYDEMEAYLKRLNDMKSKIDTPPEEYAAITLDTVVEGLNRAGSKTSGGDEYTRAKLTAEIDSGSINDLYAEILKMSGIVTKTAGEAAATSTSR